jgi:hypothetical protein
MLSMGKPMKRPTQKLMLPTVGLRFTHGIWLMAISGICALHAVGQALGGRQRRCGSWASSGRSASRQTHICSAKR